ncbi:unnamed protein product [Triticum turgidum subsp. durum]|uniref:non-specific serine/threonine protein kinase n=1 Tax=Triticum turgidum subsp. durum TaxID=4567 RepID=A0A9R1S4X7_TRITD|nr:unnamed protein product [Triticum turgidum subsp. durum]
MASQLLEPSFGVGTSHTAVPESASMYVFLDSKIELLAELKNTTAAREEVELCPREQEGSIDGTSPQFLVAFSHDGILQRMASLSFLDGAFDEESLEEDDTQMEGSVKEKTWDPEETEEPEDESQYSDDTWLEEAVEEKTWEPEETEESEDESQDSYDTLLEGAVEENTWEPEITEELEDKSKDMEGKWLEEPQKEGTWELEGTETETESEEERMNENFSVTLRIWSTRANLVFYDSTGWIFTKAYSLQWLSIKAMESLVREMKESRHILNFDASTIHNQQSIGRCQFEGLVVSSCAIETFIETQISPSFIDFELEKCLVNICREVTILSSLRNEYIVKFSQAWVESNIDVEYKEASEDGSIIGDFGQSCFRPNDCPTFTATPNLGTLGYEAPELEAGKNISEKVDIFPLGIMYFSLFISYATLVQRHNEYIQFKNDTSRKNWECLSWQGDSSFCMELTAEDPLKRPCAADILESLHKRTRLSQKCEKSTKNDVKMIENEGCETQSEEELRQTCHHRGHLGLRSTEEIWKQVAAFRRLGVLTMVVCRSWNPGRRPWVLRLHGWLYGERCCSGGVSSWLCGQQGEAVGSLSRSVISHYISNKVRQGKLPRQPGNDSRQDDTGNAHFILLVSGKRGQQATAPNVWRASSVHQTLHDTCRLCRRASGVTAAWELIHHSAYHVVASSTLASGGPGVLLSFARIPVVSFLGPCNLVAGATLHDPIELYNSMIEKDTTKEANRAYMAAREESDDAVKVALKEDVPLALIEKVDAMFQKYEKDIDGVDAQTGNHLQLSWDHDGKVTPKEAAAAKGCIEKGGIQELISELSKDKGPCKDFPLLFMILHGQLFSFFSDYFLMPTEGTISL